MQTPYRKVKFEDVERLVSWCQDHAARKGSLFEVYKDPGGINRIMVIVNYLTRQKERRTLKPLGTFYCNYIAPGIISVDEYPEQQETPSNLEKIKRIKLLIDRLLREARPGVEIDLSSL